MSERMKALLPNRLPVSVVTGFLGSGKTTLINYLVRQEGLGSTALIINEFGEIGIDNLLVETAIENTLLLENGCICCSLRGDLIDTICDLFAKVRNEQIPQFSRILIETTGLADPGPIINSIQSDKAVIDRCLVDRVITVVDGVQGKAQTSKFEEAMFQIVQADIGLISKSDLISSDHLNQLRNFLHQINPTLIIEVVEHGRIDPALLFSDLVKSPSYPILEDHGNRHKSHHDTAHEIESRHNDIASWSLVYEKPLDEVKLRDWLSMIYSLRPFALLRMKGIIKLSNSDRPMFLEAVGNVVGPPKWLESWPNGKEETQLVLIFKGLSEEALTKSFHKYVLS